MLGLPISGVADESLTAKIYKVYRRGHLRFIGFIVMRINKFLNVETRKSLGVVTCFYYW